MNKKFINFFKNRKDVYKFFIKSVKNLGIIAVASITIVAAFSAISIFGTYKWLSDHQQKEIAPKVLNYIETTLNLSSNHKTKIKNLTLEYDENNTLSIGASISVAQKFSSENFLEVQNIDINADFSESIKNLSIPLDIKMSGLELNLNNVSHDTEADLKESYEKKRNFYKIIRNKVRLLTPRKPIYIKNISVDNSDIVRNNTHYSLQQKTKYSSEKSITTTSLTTRNEISTIETSVHHNNGDINLSTEINNLPTWFLVSIFSPEYSSQLQYVTNDQSNVSGNIKFSFNNDKRKHLLGVDLHSTKTLPENIFTEFKIKADNYDNINNIRIKDLYLLSHNRSKLKATATVGTLHGLSLRKLNADLTNLSIEQLTTLWPNTKASSTRNWIKDSLSGGSCDAKINFTLSRIYKKPVANVKFHDLTLNYSNDFDPLTNLNGDIDIYGTKIDIKVKEGLLLSTPIDAKAKINFSKKDIPLNIKVSTHGPLKDHVNFLGTEAINALNSKDLNIKNIGGIANSNIKISIPLGSPEKIENIKVSAEAKINDLNTSIFNLMEIKQGEFELSLDNNLMTLKGGSLVNNQKCELELLNYLKNDEEFRTKVSLYTSIIDTKEFNELFANKFRVEEGEMPAEFVYVNSKDNEVVTAQFDIDKAKFSLPDIGLVKEKNDKSSFNFELVKTPNSNWKSNSFNLTSPKIDIKSFVEITPDFSKILQFDADTDYHGNKFIVRYASTQDKTSIKIRGDTIDLNDASFLNIENIGIYSDRNVETSSYKTNENTTTSIQIDKLKMKNGVVFNNIVGNFECSKGHCTNSGFSMKINNNDDLNISLEEETDHNTWIFKTNNAADFLKGLGLYKDIEGGNLEARVSYVQDSNLKKPSSPVMVGTVHMYDFKAVKTPIITKLILLSPFGMIKKSLEESSLIPFKHMEVPFVFANNKIEINRSYAIGKVLSVGLDGSVDRKTSVMNIKGKVIPKTKFNSVLAKMKGENASTAEKQGLISTNFSIKGTIEDPSVYMNPIGATVSFLLRLSPLGLV